jgi:hypothetical protein
MNRRFAIGMMGSVGLVEGSGGAIARTCEKSARSSRVRVEREGRILIITGDNGILGERRVLIGAGDDGVLGEGRARRGGVGEGRQWRFRLRILRIGSCLRFWSRIRSGILGCRRGLRFWGRIRRGILSWRGGLWFWGRIWRRIIC